jgi:glutamyl-Q tRNA(Asp) synthetase
LSKQTLAPAIQADRAALTLVEALRFLGQDVSPELASASLPEVWSWAFAHWSFAAIPFSR